MPMPPADTARVPAELRDLPRPGGGRTWDRWQALTQVAAKDLAAVRLGEGHADAVAICGELAPERPVPSGDLGVWAAEAPPGAVVATRSAKGWEVTGSRAWCSGATTLDQALITAHAEDGLRLFLVPLRQTGVSIDPDSWPAVGMAGTDSLTVHFDRVPVEPGCAVGRPGDYLARPGFWFGAMGVAACWYGGAVGVGVALVHSARARPEPHRLAHLGAVDSVLTDLLTDLKVTAEAVDRDPCDETGTAQLRARRLRASVERGCDEVLARTGRATGAEPLCRDRAHARRVADLTVYLRQSHAESDLAALGRLVLDGGADAGWLG